MSSTPVFDEALAQRLPLPLAQLYRRAHNAKTPLERHLNAFYLWEAAIKLLGTTAVALYATSGTRDAHVEGQLRSSFARPALGHWWGIVREVVPKLAALGDRAFQTIRESLFVRVYNDLPFAALLNAQLAEFAGGRRVARTAVRLTGLIERLIEFRNREVGHGASGARGDEFHVRWGPLLLGGAAEVLDRVDVLAGRVLAYRDAQDDVRWRWWGLTERANRLPEGEHPIADVEHRECVYLLGPSAHDAPAPLHPLALFDATSSRYFFYHTGGAKYEYLDYTTGAVREVAPLWSLEALLAGQIPTARAAHPSDPDSGTQPRTLPAEIPARKVLGEFELLGELGRGGMGIVYRAWQPSLGREVALKRLPWTGNERAAEQFQREIEALSRVEHPNLIRIYTFGADGEDRYYAMELVEGATLAEVCAAARSSRVPAPTWAAVVGAACAERETGSRARHSPAPGLPPGAETPRLDRAAIRQVVELLAQIASAAHALHGAGVVHCDIKPGNVMVGRDGRQATLMDLGIAQVTRADPHRSQALPITPRYASPEQLRNNSVDARADVYSLGATLWESLTLAPIYGTRLDENLFALMARIVTENVGRPSTFNSAIDPALDAIVLKCLAKGPEQRYASAQALADNLRRWLEGEQFAVRLLDLPESAVEAPGNAVVGLGAEVGQVAAPLSGRNSASSFDMEMAVPDAPPKSAGGTGGNLRALVLVLVAVTCGLVVAFLNSQMSAKSTTESGWGLGGGTYIGWALATVFGATTLWQWARVRKLRAELEQRELVRPLLADLEPVPQSEPVLDLDPEPSSAGLPPLPPVPPLSVFEANVAQPYTTAPETTQPGSTAVKPLRRHGDEAFSSQTVVLRYPAPMAIAYRRFCARKEPPDRLVQLFSTFEITVKYLVYLAHSDLARARVKAGPPYDPLPGYSGFDFTRRPVRMTLGQWLEALRTAADELKNVPDRFFTELPDVCRSGGALDREIVHWIKANRNVWAHIEDGQSLTTEECQRLLPEARPRLERLFQEIDFVRRYPLGFVTSGFPVSGDLVRYRVHSCMGARVAHGEEVYPMETAVRFPVGVPFVVSPDESAALCLWPFLLYRESDATQRPALYVFKGIEKNERFMAAVEAVAIDHKDTWSKRLTPTGAADHNWLWEALAQLPQTIAIAPELRLADGLAESLVGRLTGEVLGAKKHIKLIGPIARGGFGTVYDAFDTERNMRVAVKVLEDREGLDPKEDMAQFKRFHQEYEKLQKAGTATNGFVRTFEWGTSIIGRREYPWFSMEFAAGGDLTARLEERRTVLQERLPWTEPEAREAVVAEFRAVASAVKHLHELNIVHRDVKPGNILVMDEGELRLSDFGLVKDLDRPRAGASVGPGSTRGAVVGTRDYMAPEQERGEMVTPAADVYALGILLAELSTGRRPVSSTGAVAGSPVERDERVLKLPDALRRLIARCTDLDPEARPEDAGHVLLEFEKVARKHG